MALKRNWEQKNGGCIYPARLIRVAGQPYFETTLRWIPDRRSGWRV